MRRVLAAVLAGALVGSGCNTEPGVEYYVAALDELAAPAGWELAQTRLHGPGQESDCDPIWSIGCPAVNRWYLTGGDALTALDQAKQAIAGAGFEIEEVTLPWCDGIPAGPVCMVFGRRGADRLVAAVYVSPAAAGIVTEVTDQVVVEFEASR